jgi:hypothetical protein
VTILENLTVLFELLVAVRKKLNFSAGFIRLSVQKQA